MCEDGSDSFSTRAHDRDRPTWLLLLGPLLCLAQGKAAVRQPSQLGHGGCLQNTQHVVSMRNEDHDDRCITYRRSALSRWGWAVGQRVPWGS